MKGILTIVRSSGTVEILEVTEHSYKLFREIVGGPIESVPYWNEWAGLPCVVLCNEEGKLTDEPFNAVATAMWYDKVPRMYGVDALYGDVVIIQGDREFMQTL